MLGNREGGGQSTKKWPLGSVFALGFALFGVALFSGWTSHATDFFVDRYPTVAYPLLAFLAFFATLRRIQRYRETGEIIHIGWAAILGPGGLIFLLLFLRHL